MQVTIGTTKDESRILHKTFSTSTDYVGTLREECSITAPTIRIAAPSMPSGNYAHIPAFNRYYYISDVVSIRTGIWDVSMTCDVLHSFEDSIRNATAILESTEQTGQETYLPGDTWKATAKAKTDIIQFPNGLLNSGEYILITSGGIGGVSNGD